MIQFYKFSERWHLYFEREKRILSNALEDQRYVKIEHVGATSVVLCNTSGTIDILLSINSELDFFTIKNVLLRKGYSFVKDKSNSHIFFFFRRDENKKIVATVRLVEFAGEEYNKIKLFKYYLQEKNEHAIRYNELRNSLAINTHGDRKEYEKGKIAYILSILESNCKAQ